MHPGAWLVWSLCAGLVALTTTNPFYLAPVYAAAFAVHAVHHRPGPMARSFRIFALAGAVTLVTRTALVLLGPVTAGSVVTALLEGARLATLLAVFGAFNSVADPYGVLRLAPRRFHEAALATALALSLAPRTVAAVGRVREAQRMRGLDTHRWRTIPALAVPVLETGMEEALTLAESMDARGYGAARRTRLRPARWDAPSAACALSGAAGAAVVIGALASGAPLHMPAFPLAWPEVSPLVLAGVFFLAAPAFVPEPRR